MMLNLLLLSYALGKRLTITAHVIKNNFRFGTQAERFPGGEGAIWNVPRTPISPSPKQVLVYDKLTLLQIMQSP